MALGIMPELRASKTAAHLWAILGKYGYHIGRNGKVEALRIGADFDARIQNFVKAHLMKDKYMTDRMWVSLKHILYLDQRKGREAVAREEAIGNLLVNELVLVWACYFLFNGYYRLSLEEVLKMLKVELVGLLREFGYTLDSEHALFCPYQEWEKQKIWIVVSNCDKLSLERGASEREEIERLIPSCDECPVRLTAAR